MERKLDLELPTPLPPIAHLSNSTSTNKQTNKRLKKLYWFDLNAALMKLQTLGYNILPTHTPHSRGFSLSFDVACVNGANFFLLYL